MLIDVDRFWRKLKPMPFLPSMTGNINEGYPNIWMVDVVENPNLKWVINGGTPIYLGKL